MKNKKITVLLGFTCIFSLKAMEEHCYPLKHVTDPQTCATANLVVASGCFVIGTGACLLPVCCPAMTVTAKAVAGMAGAGALCNGIQRSSYTMAITPEHSKPKTMTKMISMFCCFLPYFLSNNEPAVSHERSPLNPLAMVRD